MNRIVLPEMLDVLPPHDPAAQRSRRDLRRLNAWMRHPQLMADTLRRLLPDGGAGPVIELGAGDGHFLLSVARRLNGRWRGTQAVLVDRLPALDPAAPAAFQGAGWEVRAEIAEAAEWLRQVQVGPGRTLVSNLFLHQFPAPQLAELLRLSARAVELVVALEPRRSRLNRLVGRCLWAIGCGPVTRYDANVSIRSGFAGTELSALWPDREAWELTERPAGLFSHLFVARRKE